MDKNKEIYAIVGLEKKYLSLLVTNYSDSQFYVLFNERHYYQEESFFNEAKELKKKGKILSQLIKKAEKRLNFKISAGSYNLPVKNLKIFPHNYFYQFSKPVLLTKEKLLLLNEKFLTSGNDSKKKYQNFLFKINQYVLLNQREILTKPPLNRIISSLKVNGYLYQVHWQQLYNYQRIFKTAKLKQINPILLPYALHIGLLFTEKKTNLVIAHWNEDEIQLFYFENKIFIKYFVIKKSLKSLIAKISNELNYEEKECKNYLFNLFNFSDHTMINKLDFFVNNHNPKLEKINKNIHDQVEKFFQKVINEINFLLETKWNLTFNQSGIYVVGEITEISGLEDFIQSGAKKYSWKVSTNSFIGFKDQNDIFLIGNAYYRHLQTKLSQQISK